MNIYDLDHLPALPEEYDKPYYVSSEGITKEVLARLRELGYTIVHRPYFAMGKEGGCTHDVWQLNPHRKSGVDAAPKNAEAISLEAYLELIGKASTGAVASTVTEAMKEHSEMGDKIKSSEALIGQKVWQMFGQEEPDDFQQVPSTEKRLTMGLCRYLTDDDVSFAMFIPEISEAKPRASVGEMIQEVRRLGLGYGEYIARWEEEGSLLERRQLLVRTVSLKQAMRIGKKFDQPLLIYKDREGIRELCISDGGDRCAGDILRRIPFDPAQPLSLATAMALFAGREAGDVTVGTFELRQKYLINAWHGFEYLKIMIHE